MRWRVLRELVTIVDRRVQRRRRGDHGGLGDLVDLVVAVADDFACVYVVMMMIVRV